jgi:hypothetical protein
MASSRNAARPLSFADHHIHAELVEHVEDYVAHGIVVNLTPETIFTGGDVPTPIRPWRSTILSGQTIRKADRIAVLRITEPENLGGVMLRGWSWFGDIFAGFPRQTPLFLSSSDIVGMVTEDPKRFTGERTGLEEPKDFEVLLKCWWSPNETDCFIHNEHPFLEVHTQIMGQGRMQKFHARDAATVYEDVLMMPGFTHEAFCTVAAPDSYVYPWHRYYTDVESVWLAVELHPR